MCMLISFCVMHLFMYPYLNRDYGKIVSQDTSFGSNTFGTMKTSSRQELFEPLRVDYSGSSGGIIRIMF